MHRIDSAGATADNKFTEGDAATGVAATVVTDDWLNATQEEIAHVIEQTGGTLNKLNNTQLWAALSGWFAKGVQATETVLGIAKVATQAQTDAGTDDATIVTPKKLRAGFAVSLGVNGYIAFPTWMGGLIIQWGKTAIPGPNVAAGGKAVMGDIAFPLAFPSGPYIVNAITDASGSTGAEHGEVRINTEGYTATLFGVAGARLSGSYTAGEVCSIAWMAIGR